MTLLGFPQQNLTFAIAGLILNDCTEILFFLPSLKADKVISELMDMRITAHAFAAGQTGKRGSQ